jgi:hypothetical protein
MPSKLSPWPQTGLGYIVGKVVVISNFLQEVRLQNYPITPKNGVITLKMGLITFKNPKFS